MSRSANFFSNPYYTFVSPKIPRGIRGAMPSIGSSSIITLTPEIVGPGQIVNGYIQFKPLSGGMGGTTQKELNIKKGNTIYVHHKGEGKIVNIKYTPDNYIASIDVQIHSPSNKGGTRRRRTKRSKRATRRR